MLTPVSHPNIWYCRVSFIHVHCVKVHTVKKSRIENLNSEIGSKEAENMDRWQHTTMSSSPGRGGQAPFSRYTRILSIHSAMYTGAASMLWVAAGYSELHDAFDRLGLVRLVERR